MHWLHLQTSAKTDGKGIKQNTSQVTEQLKYGTACKAIPAIDVVQHPHDNKPYASLV